MKRHELNFYIWRRIEFASNINQEQRRILAQEMYEEIEKLIEDEIKESETREIIKKMELN